MIVTYVLFFVKQKTAYEMRISDWSSDVCSSEAGDERVDRGDHQMHVEHPVGVRAQRLHDGGADRQVGHEMPVHDVDVNPVGAGVGDGADLFAQPREVGGPEDRKSVVEGKSGAVGVDLGGRRVLKKKKK